MSFTRIASAIAALNDALAEHNINLSAVVTEGEYVHEQLIGIARSDGARLQARDLARPATAFTINGVRILT